MRVFWVQDPVTGEMKPVEVKGKEDGVETVARVKDKLAKTVSKRGAPRKYPPVCTVDGCMGRHRAKGLCGACYERKRRNGSVHIRKRTYSRRTREPWTVAMERRKGLDSVVVKKEDK